MAFPNDIAFPHGRFDPVFVLIALVVLPVCLHFCCLALPALRLMFFVFADVSSQ